MIMNLNDVHIGTPRFTLNIDENQNEYHSYACIRCNP